MFDRNYSRPVSAEEPTPRRTVIPTPRSNAMFAGWGIRF